MSTITLTKDERKAVVDWLNGASGDPDFWITRLSGDTHLKRTTHRVPNSKWKVRIAYEAETGYPVAMGSPIQSEKSGKHEQHLGKASMPESVKATQKTAQSLYKQTWAKLVTPKPTLSIPKSGFDFLFSDDPIQTAKPAPQLETVSGVKLSTKYGPVHLIENEQYTGQFVYEYGLKQAFQDQAPAGWSLEQVPNQDLFTVLYLHHDWLHDGCEEMCCEEGAP